MDVSYRFLWDQLYIKSDILNHEECKLIDDFIYECWLVNNRDKCDKYFNNSNDKKSFKTYLIKDQRTGLYKIGKSKNPKLREKTLQGENPLCEIVKTWDKDIEKYLHDNYKNQRIRGEWFNLSEIQVKYITTCV